MGYSQENAATGDALTRDLFLVTSGMMNSYGVFTQSQKFSQVVDTIHSIRRHMHNVLICAIDCSVDPVPQHQVDHLESLGVQFYQTKLDPGYVMPTRLDPNQFSAKSKGEVTIMHHFFDVVLPSQDNIRRVHKLSGRYQLMPIYATHDFDVQDVMTGPSKQWLMGPDRMNESEGVYGIKVWNFHAALTDTMKLVWRDIGETSEKFFRELQKIRVLEAQFFASAHKYQVPCRAMNTIGVKGYYAQDGCFEAE